MSTFRRVVDIFGRVLIGLGVLVLLFTAYQIWGTSVQEAHVQSGLRSQLQKDTTSDAVRNALAQESALDKLPTGPPVPAPTTAAPAEGEPIGDIRIPVIGINQVVVEGTNTPDLRKGPGHYTGTPLPGQSGQRLHRGPPDHLRPPLLQPRFGQGRRPDRPHHAAGDLRLRRHEELRRLAQRYHRGGQRDRRPAHADDLQSALQRHDRVLSSRPSWRTPSSSRTRVFPSRSVSRRTRRARAWPATPASRSPTRCSGAPSRPLW